MFCKALFCTLFIVFTGLLLTAQGPVPLTIRFQPSRALHFRIECTIEGVRYEIDETGTVSNVSMPAEKAVMEDETRITYWQAGWNGREGKIKSIDRTDFDYWTPGWGDEKEGKIKSIGSLRFDYWSPGWGKEKEGKLKSVGAVVFDYWAPGWGREKEGKIKLIGSAQFDYWSTGWGKRAGTLKSVKGADRDVTIWMPVL